MIMIVKLHLPRVRCLITLCAFVGFVVSAYAYYVESQLENDPNYKASCDFSERVNCSKAFYSKYGRGFGIFENFGILNQPNSVYGMLFYASVITLRQFSKWRKSAYYMTILSNVCSLYFAYILVFILQTLCIICVSVYVINVLLLILQKKEFELLKKLD